MIDATSTARPRPRPRAFTLVEMVVAIALTAIIASALMSGFLLSLRAIPATDDPGMTAYEIDRAFEHLLTDASLASEIAVSNGKVSMLVPDQTGDDTPDRVTYRPELGVLYPSQLDDGMRIYVEYDVNDPDLVRVRDRNASLAIIPAGSIAVVGWLVAGAALGVTTLVERRIDRRTSTV